MNVDVVIVTYNRLEKLKKALASYENQTKSFRSMIVVNNHSTDGTYEYLEEWKNEEAPFTKYVITTEDNLGGSGGFYTGQEFAMTLNPDWVYLADDDAYAEHDMMEQFYKFCETHDVGKLSAICGAVCDVEGKIAYQHRSTYKIIDKRVYKRDISVQEDYQKEYFRIDMLSYVCSFINSQAIRRVGMVNPQYFIYYDDTEHSIRLKKFGDILCVPAIRIDHDDAGNVTNEQNIEASWQDYYFNRNKIHMLKKHHFVAAAFYTRRVLKEIKRGDHTAVQARLVKDALRDAWMGRLGKHSKYKPGWKVVFGF